MKCINKTNYETCLRNYKNDRYKAEMLMETYLEGDSSLGVKKNLGKAVKILKHWEKSIDTHKDYYFVYNNLHKIYKEKGKTKESNIYGIKYFSSRIKNENEQLIDYYYRNLINLELDCVIDYKGKIKNKKMVDTLIEHYEKYLKVIKSLSDIKYSNMNPRLIKLFTNKDVNKLYLVHIINSYYDGYKVTDSNNLINMFTDEDFISYLKVLDYKAFNAHKDFKKYLNTYYLFYRTKCNDDVKLDYARQLGIDSKFTVRNYNSALEIAKECYKNGSKEALYLLIDLYESVKSQTNIVDLLEEHIKTYKNDHKAHLLLADYYFKYFYDFSLGAKDKVKIKKAIGIYEKNHKELNNKQLDTLSNVYLKGHCVEKNLDKAKLYSKSNGGEIAKHERIASFSYLDNIVVKDVSFKSRFEKLKKGVLSNNDDSIIELINLINHGYAFEFNKEISDKLVDILIENNNLYGYLKRYSYTFDNKCFEVLQSDETAYKYLALYYNLISTNADVSLIRQALLKAVELGSLEAKRAYAVDLYRAKYFERDVELSYKLYKELLDEGYCDYSGYFFSRYNIFQREENNLEWLYEQAKKCADMTNNHHACYKLYCLNDKINKMKESEAIVYLIRAHNNKHHQATIDLAIHYYFGYSKGKIAADGKKAFELFSQAVEESKLAGHYLGRCYFYGYGTKQNYKKAFELFNNVYKDIPETLVYMADCYRFGYGVKADYTKAMEFYEQASKVNGYGLYALAKVYCYGMDGYVKVDHKKSIKLNLEALKTYENVDVYFDLGYSYRQLNDYKNALKYYKKTIKLNDKHKEALYNLGLLYETSEFEGKNYKEAIKYYELAYKAGDLDGALNVAVMKMMRNYDMVDMDGALPYLKAAYEGKVEDAEVYYAYYYEHHKNDEKEAYNLIKDSKSENNLKYLVLGNLYYSGKYLSKDYKKAFENFQKAYEIFQENPYVWYRLGRCYYFGNGVERDTNRAYDFMSLAAKEDFSEAKSFIEEYFSNK